MPSFFSVFFVFARYLLSEAVCVVAAVLICHLFLACTVLCREGGFVGFPLHAVTTRARHRVIVLGAMCCCVVAFVIYRSAEDLQKNMGLPEGKV